MPIPMPQARPMTPPILGMGGMAAMIQGQGKPAAQNAGIGPPNQMPGNKPKAPTGGMDLIKLLLGMQDARGAMGQAARGTNVYNGTSSAPNTGGTVAPIDFAGMQQGAIQRRLKGARQAVGATQGGLPMNARMGGL